MVGFTLLRGRMGKSNVRALLFPCAQNSQLAENDGQKDRGQGCGGIWDHLQGVWPNGADRSTWIATALCLQIGVLLPGSNPDLGDSRFSAREGVSMSIATARPLPEWISGTTAAKMLKTTCYSVHKLALAKRIRSRVELGQTPRFFTADVEKLLSKVETEK